MSAIVWLRQLSWDFALHFAQSAGVVEPLEAGGAECSEGGRGNRIRISPMLVSVNYVN
jgi:hypothetical protein